MKLSFSTLGCPDWSFSEIFSTAKDLHFDGIEIRGIANELYVPRAKRFLPEKIDATIKKLTDGSIEIPMLTTGISVGEVKGPDQFHLDLAAAKDYIDLANKLKTKYIRIMISSSPQPTEIDRSVALDLYEQMCEYGAQNDVTPLVETNGVLANSAVCMEFLNEIKSPNKGVLWDVHHPHRFFGETCEQTVTTLGTYIKHVHVKDSIVKNGEIIYRMMGYGDVPVFDALAELKKIGYAGYISLEWVKRWNPDLEEPGIVFAHFMSYMQQTAIKTLL